MIPSRHATKLESSALILAATTTLACGSDTEISPEEQRALDRCAEFQETPECAPNRYDNCLACNETCEEPCAINASLCNEDWECDVP